MTILRTKVVVKRVATTSAIETSTTATGITPKFESASTSTRTASFEDSLAYGVELAGPAIETVLLGTTAAAEDVAAYLAGVNSAYPQLATITVQNDNDTRGAFIRDVDLNDRVLASENVTNTTLDSFVEQIEHRITNGGLNHELRLLVSARGRSIGIFTSDASTPDIFSQFVNDPPDTFNYAVFGY